MFGFMVSPLARVGCLGTFGRCVVSHLAVSPMPCFYQHISESYSTVEVRVVSLLERRRRCGCRFLVELVGFRVFVIRFM